jgi:hypothetical protein
MLLYSFLWKQRARADSSWGKMLGLRPSSSHVPHANQGKRIVCETTCKSVPDSPAQTMSQSEAQYAHVSRPSSPKRTPYIILARAWLAPLRLLPSLRAPTAAPECRYPHLFLSFFSLVPAGALLSVSLFICSSSCSFSLSLFCFLILLSTKYPLEHSPYALS